MGTVLLTSLNLVQRESCEYLYSHFPGLEDKLSIDDYLAERVVMQDAAFRAVPPMRGAVALVQGLVRASATVSNQGLADKAARRWYPHRIGDRINKVQLRPQDCESSWGLRIRQDAHSLCCPATRPLPPSPLPSYFLTHTGPPPGTL